MFRVMMLTDSGIIIIIPINHIYQYTYIIIMIGHWYIIIKYIHSHTYDKTCLKRIR